MPDQVTGYYSARKESLLNEFDHTMSLIEDLLITRFGKEFASQF